jgi:uncharacterized membrane protein YbaN (DUF454 family)
MHKHVISKLTVLILVVLCLALGVVGLLLPIIPGLLFLALAAALVARHSPWAGERLRRHRGIGRCLDHADGFIDSDWSAKLRLSLLYAAKAVVETLAAATRAIRGAVDRRRPDRSRFTI